jgi:hypothetical protein
MATSCQSRHLCGVYAPTPEVSLSEPVSPVSAIEEKLQAAAFRRLLRHLRERTDVQNIDLMNLAGFCRNCLSRWYREAASEQGIAMADPEAREIIYGMAYKEWQKLYQREATPEQLAAFAKAPPAG